MYKPICQMIGVKLLKYIQSFFKKFPKGLPDYAQLLATRYLLERSKLKQNSYAERKSQLSRSLRSVSAVQ